MELHKVPSTGSGFQDGLELYESAKSTVVFPELSPKSPGKKTAVEWNPESPLTWNKIMAYYEKARYHKQYGHELPLEEKHAIEFLQQAKALVAGNPTADYMVMLYFFNEDDQGTPSKGIQDFTHECGELMFLANNLALDRKNPERFAVKLHVSGLNVLKIIDKMDRAHIIEIYPINRPKSRIGEYTRSSNYFTKIQYYRQKEGIYWFKKGMDRPIFTPPTPEELTPFIPYIYQWINGRVATTYRILSDAYRGDELSFYRHYQEDGVRKNMIYSNLDTVKTQINRGAFCFVPDSHFEQQKKITGPFVATIDIDSKFAEFEEINQRVGDFADFLKEQTKLEYTLVHSGNKSYHFKFFLADFQVPEFDLNNPQTLAHQILPNEKLGFIMPKLTMAETQFQRREKEMNILMVRDAIDVLILMYNQWTQLDQVACNFKKYSNRSKFKFFFDDRSGVHQGARIPGSWHEKSGRVARVFTLGQIPQNESDLYHLTSLEYIQEHLTVLRHPPISQELLDQNGENLFAVTTQYFSQNFHNLVYKEDIFHE